VGMTFPEAVKIVEVGPRDGLQNEFKTVPTAIKVEFINQLSNTGLTVIEATSFVSPKWIPQLADHQDVYKQIIKKPSVRYPVLVPNKRGMESALDVKVKDIAVFATPSEQFSQHNTNCSVAESLRKIEDIMQIATDHGIQVRGYLSCVLGCPYEGDISPLAVADLAEKLLHFGCHEISLGDTIGVGTPRKTQILLEAVLKKIPRDKIAVHFHDTYGQAIVNIYAALELGISVIDSSVAGLGGCPYAKGASGNVATEDVVYLLNGLNISTGVDLKKLCAVGQFITSYLGRPMQSKVNLAMSNSKSE
jgi:hydroxymethylglutaryl-CoA lyase